MIGRSNSHVLVNADFVVEDASTPVSQCDQGGALLALLQAIAHDQWSGEAQQPQYGAVCANRCTHSTILL
jgi:hypothetical protein